MKYLTTAALAGALAISAVAVTPTAAGADSRHYRPHQHYSGGGNAGAALAAGAILGFAFGALATPYYAPPYYAPYYAYPYPPPPPPAPIFYPRVTSAHIAWCSNQYGAWYDAATDTWTDYYGVTHRCIAPY